MCTPGLCSDCRLASCSSWFLVIEHRLTGALQCAPLQSVLTSNPVCVLQFAAMNKLKKAALMVMARNLSHDEISGLRQLFKSIDLDNSGTITVDELKVKLYCTRRLSDIWLCCLSEIAAALL